MKWVSQVNGPSAPAQSTLGFPGQQKEQEYKQQQQQQKREDQADLQQRHAEIIRILKAPAMDDGPELGAVESRITSIRLNVQVYSTSVAPRGDRSEPTHAQLLDGGREDQPHLAAYPL